MATETRKSPGGQDRGDSQKDKINDDGADLMTTSIHGQQTGRTGVGTMNAPILDAALKLAAAGWTILPCQPSGEHGKAPLTRHGHHDSTTDPDQIREWWQRWPSALIGAPVPSTLLVLDIDPRNGGTRKALAGVLGPLPETLSVESGRGDGGMHLYYRRPAGPLHAANLPAGVDLKVNGYCILPPSPHPATGQPYMWRRAPVAFLPRQAVEALTVQPRPAAGFTQTDSDGSHLIRFLHRFPDHGINAALYWASCRAAETGVLDRIRDDLITTAVELGESRRQAEATTRSADNAPAK